MTQTSLRRILFTVLFVLTAAALLRPDAAYAQPPVAQTPPTGEVAAGRPPTTAMLELVLRDGSRLFGTVTSETPDEIVLRTAGGTVVKVQRSEIASLGSVKGSLVDGEFLPADPNATRLFFGPTGRSLGRGKTYLGVYEFIMPFVQVGVTDRLSIGGGTPLIAGFDDWDRPFWITPKLQILNRERTQLAVGTFHVFDGGGDGGGVGYVVATQGDSRTSFTVGAGLAYGTGGGRSGIVMLGGERQVRRNLKLITENYVWKDGNGVASAGVRFFGDRLSADLALGVPVGTNEFFVFPVVNFVYAF